jgi:hypothetical protein
MLDGCKHWLVFASQIPRTAVGGIAQIDDGFVAREDGVSNMLT